MSLTEFLLARIAEDEAWAMSEEFPQPWHMGARRALAECEAKRRIVARADSLTDDSHLQDIGWELLGHLALPYADHPDYREEWKP